VTEIDWNELVQSKKSVMACDKYFCGNVIAQYHDDIIIIEGATIKSHEYIVPKSKVDITTEMTFISILLVMT
jgi:hypothetical protein